jgi:uncharacterized protein (UPF0548 family)
VLRLTRPSPADLERTLGEARSAEPTYSEVGGTNVVPMPAGYKHARYETRLGAGEAAFGRAVDGLRAWQAHLGAGVQIMSVGTPIETGETVVLVLRAIGLWVLAPCRIVYVIDETERFGFAYGTLPGHPERGESAFIVHRGDGASVFEITSFSRPEDRLARAASPVARLIQKRVTGRYLRALEHATAGHET